jgi:dephospho-CoA kinase
MPLIYITGIAGSGKTTVLKELEHRGYEVHDADEKLSYWANKTTGARVHTSDHKPMTDPKFFAEHEWHMDKRAVEELANSDKTTFIGGSVVNEKDVWDYFDKVFVLYVNNEALTHRLMHRADKDFGKAEHELKHVLKLNSEVPAKYMSLGATIIDATQSTEKIADEICAETPPSAAY